ncbi:MAG: DUF4158 domain-containing protein [Acidobacteriaceae bacterium]|nr:DUF4158 domain-containing protein [Acidobacteriaceae bacterium]
MFRFRSYKTSPVPSILRDPLRSEALATDSAYSLIQSAAAWLREHRVILPALSTLQSVVRSVRSEVERQIYQYLAKGLSQAECVELDKMLEIGPTNGSLLGWVRRVPRSCSPAGIS